MEMIKLYLAKFKVFVILAVILLIVIFVSLIYNKGYKSGFNDAQKELDKKYQAALENKIKKQQESLQASFDVILQNEKNKSKVETVYVDRIKTVKEVSKSDNFKCELTKEQVDILNQATRKPK